MQDVAPGLSALRKGRGKGESVFNFYNVCIEFLATGKLNEE